MYEISNNYYFKVNSLIVEWVNTMLLGTVIIFSCLQYIYFSVVPNIRKKILGRLNDIFNCIILKWKKFNSMVINNCLNFILTQCYVCKSYHLKVYLFWLYVKINLAMVKNCWEWKVSCLKKKGESLIRAW
jgi:hypothetical protein